MKKAISLFLSVCLLFSLCACNKLLQQSENDDESTNNTEVPNSEINYTYDEYNSFMEGFTDVLVTDEKSAIEAVASVGDALGIKDAGSDLKVCFTNKRETDTYYRLQQYYGNIPVFGRSITIAADERGKALGLTANYLPIEYIDTNPLLDENQIVEIISNEYSSVDSQINNGLIVYTLYGSAPILAYDITVSKCNESEMIYEQCIISAENGDILFKNSFNRTYLKHSLDEYTHKVNDKTYLMYDESRNILILNSNKKLLECKPTVKDGIEYLAISNDGKTNENANPLWDKNKTLICGDIEIEGSRNANWKDEPVNLINSIENTYDFYSKILKWNGYDNKNSPMLASYNDYYYSNGNNACSKGNVLVFGYEQDLTDVGLVAHEFTHSVEISTLNLIYSGESGAISEAYADIFGELAEDYAKDGTLNGDCDWIHGERNMSKPSDNGYPTRYLDDNWESTIDTGEDSDYGHVHQNNTVLSHAAYLMSKGGIDHESLAHIWFNALNILQRDASFSQCRNAVELSARIMMKNNQLTEEQYRMVVMAFEQTGIENATYTLVETVKNQFNLTVLSSQGNDDVHYKLEVIKIPEIFAGINLEEDQFPKPVIEKIAITGKQSLNLEDGTYVLRITDVSDDRNISETLNIKIKVEGKNTNAKDNVVVNTDFTDVIVVILNGNDDNNSDDNNNIGESEESSDTSESDNSPSYETEAILSPKSAVKIYMLNRSIWMENPEYMPMGGYGYCLLDLDFDGVLELINSVCDGSGRYSVNKIYRINIQKETVEEIQTNNKREYDIPDYYYMSDTAELCKNNATGKLFYIFSDYTYVDSSEYGASFCGVYMHNGILYETPICSQHSGPDYDNNSSEIIKTFYFGEKEVTQSEYEQKYADFYEENTRLKFEWAYISGKEFDGDIYANQQSRLAKAYESFSYDGFSFDDVKTYDIKKEKDYYETETAEQLSEHIVGSWAKAGSSWGIYTFEKNGICYNDSFGQVGTYKILEDKRLIIDFSTGPTTHKEYVWSDLSFDEFRDQNRYEKDFWYFTSNGVLRLTGQEYYRDGKTIIETNTDGELLSTLIGTWSQKNSIVKYTFFDDCTYQSFIDYGTIVSGMDRIDIQETGKIDIINDTSAKLWGDIPDGFGYIQGYSTLIYDPEMDKIYIGGTHNEGYSREE